MSKRVEPTNQPPAYNVVVSNVATSPPFPEPGAPYQSVPVNGGGYPNYYPHQNSGGPVQVVYVQQQQQNSSQFILFLVGWVCAAAWWAGACCVSAPTPDDMKWRKANIAMTIVSVVLIVVIIVLQFVFLSSFMAVSNF